jgi:acyl-CoA thioester hydrolase
MTDADGGASPIAAAHRTAIQLRFADVDMLGHVNNVAYASYVETARVEFLRSLGGEVTSIIVAHLALDYRRPVHYGATLAVDTWVEKVGRTSVTLGQVVWAGTDRAADVRSVLVFYDYERGAPKEVPAAMREKLRLRG